MIKGGANPIQNERILLDRYDQENNPPAHKYDLKTVKYIHPREFFACRQETRGYPGSPRARAWNSHHQHPQEVGTYNKENWYNVRHGTGSGSPPPETPAFPSPPQVQRVNKLKIALRNASRENTDEESASPKLDIVVPKPKPINKLEPSAPIPIVSVK